MCVGREREDLAVFSLDARLSDRRMGQAVFLASVIDVLERRCTTPHHTIAPAPQVQGEPGRLISVTDSLVRSDDSRTLRVLQVGPTPHVEQILVAHLPRERVLYVADLFAVPETRVFPPASATFKYFAELIERFDLEFDAVIPTHGVVGTPEDLEAAVQRR